MHSSSTRCCREADLGPPLLAMMLCFLFAFGFYLCFIAYVMYEVRTPKFLGLTKHLIVKRGMSPVGTWALFNVLKAQNVSVSFVKRKPKAITTLNKMEARAKEVIEGGSIWGSINTKPRPKIGYFLTYKNDTQSLQDILHTNGFNAGGFNHNMFYQWIWRFYWNDKIIVCLESFKVADCLTRNDLSQIYSSAADIFVYNNAKDTFYYRRVYEMEAY